ncbi:hypothetical protein GWL_04410 [Herbaspirillum sp. GW103]|nr:hypothetical protein GWL_04410 [Herbaspirillum sp. GW103]
MCSFKGAAKCFRNTADIAYHNWIGCNLIYSPNIVTNFREAEVMS